MCRSIKTLRPPHAEHVTEDDIRAAALQYVRKVSGFHRPAPHNVVAFTEAVDAIEAATRVLLDRIEVRGGRRTAAPPDHDHADGHDHDHDHADGHTHDHAHAG